MKEEIKLVIGKHESVGVITEVKHIGNSNHSEVDISIATLHAEPMPLKNGKVTHRVGPDTTNITVIVPTEAIKEFLI